MAASRTMANLKVIRANRKWKSGKSRFLGFVVCGGEDLRREYPIKILNFRKKSWKQNVSLSEKCRQI
jgi:hypothetical protein